MELALSYITMVRYMRECLRIIRKMDLVIKYILMAICILGNIKRIKNMGLEFFIGLLWPPTIDKL
jgi:hypothetical protein